jgi:hypothetical protein
MTLTTEIERSGYAFLRGPGTCRASISQACVDLKRLELSPSLQNSYRLIISFHQRWIE